jgi:hypothetical protein
MSVPEGTPSGLPANVTVISIHPMYSAGQVGLATFLGGPVGGGWLMALNYKRLGEPGKARMTIGLSVLAMAVLAAIGLVTPGRSMSWLAIVAIVAMRRLAKSLQGAAYDRHVAAGGSRGSSWRAAGLGVASLAICFGAITGVAAIHAVATAPDEVVVGDSNVRYTDGATRAEAQAVGDALVELGYLETGKRATVQVTLDHGRHVVEFVVQDFVFSNGQTQQQIHELADQLSRKAFAGAKVDLWLTDDELEPHIKLTWEARPR